MIYYIVGSPSITSSNVFQGPVVHSGNTRYQIDNAELVELVDPAKQCWTNIWFDINGKTWQLRLSGPAYEFSHAEQGNISFVDETGQKLEISPEIAHLLVRASPSSRLGNLVVGHIRRYRGVRGQSLFLADTETNEFVYREKMSLSDPVLQHDGLYGYSSRSNNFTKLDHELNDIWFFDLNPMCKRPGQAIPCSDTILLYAGSTGVEALGEVQMPGEEDFVYNHGILRDGELYCLDRKAGQKRWERVFPYGLNDLVLHEDKLYCVADRELSRISPESGEIEHQVQMEYSAGGETTPYKVLSVVDNKLWITINYWFHKSFCLLVVNLETLAIEHKIDLPDPYAPDRFLFFDDKQRQVFYRLRLRYGAPYLEHWQPLMVLSLDELDRPVAFEDKPDITTEFRPAAGNKDLEELWVHIDGAPLHQAIRFGIIETQNQTGLHASVPNRRVRRRETFNGRVHFRYSGSDKPREEVEEQLKVIETSFNEWAERMNIEAGSGSGEPVSIDVAYIE